MTFGNQLRLTRGRNREAEEGYIVEESMIGRTFFYELKTAIQHALDRKKTIGSFTSLTQLLIEKEEIIYGILTRNICGQRSTNKTRK